MDEQSAIALVKNTFGEKFNESKYVNFLNELFNKAHIKKTPENLINYVGKGFSGYINSIYSVGEYKFDSSDSIEFYVVNLKRHTSIDRARTMQRNLIAKNLKNRNKIAGLVAFQEENTDDWRFSFVKLEYAFNEDFYVKEKLTPARRHSYLVGPNEPNHTCQSQFKDLLVVEDNISLEQVENCFSIENVTDEFFNKYEKLFIDLNSSLNILIEKDKDIADEFLNIKVEDFSKKLLGQLVFIYFLQKKEWLGVKRGEKFNKGSKNFLSKLYNKKFIDYSNFFNDVLEPLFYKGFSTKDETGNFHYDEFKFKVPFLNGGLFEPIKSYNWEGTDINLENKIFKDIFDTFNEFNFTVMEDQPLDKEVAVDPEMLGKVLEKLANDREDEGKYYTPREIVHYMCQQSLISYLVTNTNIPKIDIKRFIENGDISIELIIARLEKKPYKYNKKHEKMPAKAIELPESIVENSTLLEDLLRKVKVIDPAVGSGAFPVGMMNEIVKAISILQLINIGSVDYYMLKKEIIENSLYGVDKDFSATDITKLRFWLSLIVDEKNINEINALPNLDNQILCGNSLIDTFEGVDLFKSIEEGPQKSLKTYRESQQKFKILESMKNQFFNTDNMENKEYLKNEIENLKWDIIKEYLKESNNSSKIERIDKYKNDPEKPFLLYNLEFSEVFSGPNPGFDIVIGNPPYILERRNKKAFNGLRDTIYYLGKMNIWHYFGCIGLDIVKNEGIVSFIAPNNWTTAEGASFFRNKVNEYAQIDSFINFKDYKVFKDVDQQTMIYFMRKSSIEQNYTLKYSELLDKKINKDELIQFLYSNKPTHKFKKFESIFNRKVFRAKRKLSKDLSKEDIKPKEDFKAEYFTFLEKSISKIIGKIKNNETYYLQPKEVFTGIDVHQDFLKLENAIELKMENDVGVGIFVLSEAEKNKLNLNIDELSLIKPYYTTEQLFRYYADEKNDYWLIYTKSDINDTIENNPERFIHIKNHFDIFEKIITSDNKPYGLHRPRNEELFKNEKIIVTRKCKTPTFTYTNFDAYVSLTFMIIKTNKINLKVLVSILNSELIQFWLKFMGKMQGSNYQLDKKPITKIPIINNISNDVENKLVSYIDLILSNPDKNLIECEKKINKEVYKLYGLVNEEVKIVESTI